MNRKRIILAVLTLVVILYAVWSVMGVVASFGASMSFGDLEKKVANSWHADYTCFQGACDNELRGDGDTLHIGVDTEDGALTVQVHSLDGKPLYSKHFTSDGEATVDVPESVQVSVKADAHEGGFDIYYSDDQQEKA
ncbi:MAG: hypothetical protein UDG94_09145 [Peptococcaceae bacterium]|nr:hypothetical protein [Peptococcaceae bacterium]